MKCTPYGTHDYIDTYTERAFLQRQKGVIGKRCARGVIEKRCASKKMTFIALSWKLISLFITHKTDNIPLILDHRAVLALSVS